MITNKIQNADCLFQSAACQEEYIMKITTVISRDTNDSILKFILEKYPDLYTHQNKIVLRGPLTNVLLGNVHKGVGDRKII